MDKGTAVTVAIIAAFVFVVGGIWAASEVMERRDRQMLADIETHDRLRLQRVIQGLPVYRPSSKPQPGQRDA